MNPQKQLILVFAALALFNSHGRSANAGTQGFSFQLPPFATQDNWVFTSAGNGSVPQFDTLNNRLLLKSVSMNLNYPLTQDYLVTNIGQATTFGVIRAAINVTSQGPNGQIWNPNFGSSAGGPNLNPGQSGTASVSGGVNRTRTVGGLSAQPHVGTGDSNYSLDIQVTFSIDNPASITASHSGGSSQPPSFTVTYDYKCNGDANDDGEIGVADLLEVINAWGFVGVCQNSTCPADMAPGSGAIWGDGYVNVSDLLAVINHWGNCPTLQ